MTELTRRGFLQTAAAAAAVGAMRPSSTVEASQGAKTLTHPVCVSSANGLRATEKAAGLILEGQDTLDAAVAGVTIVEEDPADNSVGYGGLPNEEGIVELDACVMHGPTCKAGSVAALRNIKTPSQVARVVMQRTDHCMIVGEGALRFARAHGFKEENLLTEESRKAWLDWKERHSEQDDWLPPAEISDDNRRSRANIPFRWTYGTITCLALNLKNEMSGVTTTSGLSFKIPGRVGDSPLIGAGLFVDNKVGAVGSTGRGEAVIKISGSHTVVEAMRQGMSPSDACLHALKRIVETTTESHLRLPDGRPNFDVKFYGLAKDGTFGAASIWSGVKFAVYAEGKNRLEEAAFLFERTEKKG